MIWDVRPQVSIDPEEAQLNEGGANEWDNCGAADYLWIFKQLGFGDPFEPQQVMDKIHGVGYHGGEVSSRLIAFFKTNLPNCPEIVVEGRPDIIDRLRAIAGSMLTTNWWWSNSNGDIQPRNTGILHWSSAIYDNGSALGIRNTMRGTVVELPYAQARTAYAGEFTLFKKELPGGDDLDPDRAAEIHNTAVEITSGKGFRGLMKDLSTQVSDLSKQVAALKTGVPTAPYKATITPDKPLAAKAKAKAKPKRLGRKK